MIKNKLYLLKIIKYSLRIYIITNYGTILNEKQ